MAQDNSSSSVAQRRQKVGHPWWGNKMRCACKSKTSQKPQEAHHCAGENHHSMLRVPACPHDWVPAFLGFHSCSVHPVPDLYFVTLACPACPGASGREAVPSSSVSQPWPYWHWARHSSGLGGCLCTAGYLVGSAYLDARTTPTPHWSYSKQQCPQTPPHALPPGRHCPTGDTAPLYFHFTF